MSMVSRLLLSLLIIAIITGCVGVPRCEILESRFFSLECPVFAEQPQQPQAAGEYVARTTCSNWISAISGGIDVRYLNASQMGNHSEKFKGDLMQQLQTEGCALATRSPDPSAFPASQKTTASSAFQELM